MTYNIQINKFMFPSHTPGANLSYSHASVKRYVLSSALKTSSDEHSFSDITCECIQ